MLRVATYLPRYEYFSPCGGGALATWVHHVYTHSEFDVRVFCRHSKDNSYYANPSRDVCRTSQTLDALERQIRNRRAKGALNFPKQLLARRHAAKAARLVEGFAPTIIHIQNEFHAVPTIGERLSETPIVLHMQNDHLTEPGQLSHARIAIERAEAVAFCSAFIRDKAISVFGKALRSKALVIYNGTAGSGLKPKRTLEHERPLKILFVGRIVPDKGLHLLIEAMGTVLDQFPSCELHVVGGIGFGDRSSNEYLETCVQSAQRLTGKVVFHGPVNHDATDQHFSEADVFVCPSIWEEPFGMVNVEAMGAGVPVVAFANGGIPEAIGDAGVLVTESSAKALAKALCNLLGDQKKLEQVSKAGLRRVEEMFTWDVIAEQWCRVLKNCIS